ncbi:MAG: hypothetical protein JSW04_01845 [Desulfobacterales bacterium]|nr:MAG: hypothetical protein JSW04_01845 [Desulfobacterales bacterium]
MKTIEQRRKSDRERRERWRQRKLLEGCKQIQFMITPEAREVLKQEKERTGEAFVQIINRGIINLEKKPPGITDTAEIRPSILEKPKTQYITSVEAKPRSSTSSKTRIGHQNQLNLFTE